MVNKQHHEFKSDDFQVNGFFQLKQKNKIKKHILNFTIIMFLSLSYFSHQFAINELRHFRKFNWNFFLDEFNMINKFLNFSTFFFIFWFLSSWVFIFFGMWKPRGNKLISKSIWTTFGSSLILKYQKNF